MCAVNLRYFVFIYFAADAPTTKAKILAQLAKHGVTDSQKETHFFANIHYEQNTIEPWPLCEIRKCEVQAADTNRKQNVSADLMTTDTIVINDSDSDCDDVKTPNGKYDSFTFIYF